MLRLSLLLKQGGFRYCQWVGARSSPAFAAFQPPSPWITKTWWYYFYCHFQAFQLSKGGWAGGKKGMERDRSNGHKTKTGGSSWTSGTTCSLWGWWSPGTGCLEKWWRYSNTIWIQSWATGYRRPCLRSRFGHNTLHRSLPTSIIVKCGKKKRNGCIYLRNNVRQKIKGSSHRAQRFINKGAGLQEQPLPNHEQPFPESSWSLPWLTAAKCLTRWHFSPTVKTPSCTGCNHTRMCQGKGHFHLADFTFHSNRSKPMFPF